jgi:hypothetical protein
MIHLRATSDIRGIAISGFGMNGGCREKPASGVHRTFG